MRGNSGRFRGSRVTCGAACRSELPLPLRGRVGRRSRRPQLPWCERERGVAWPGRRPALSPSRSDAETGTTSGAHRAPSAHVRERPADRRAVLAHQAPGRDDASRVGEPVRRLRPLLPQQARSTIDTNETVLHRRRLQAARHARPAAAPTMRTARRRCRTACGSPRAMCAGSPGCRRPAPTGWWPTAAISPGGTRWYRAHPTPCTRPASRCAGASAASEKDVPDERLEDYMVAWPGKWPRGARRWGLNESVATRVRICGLEPPAFAPGSVS